MKRLSVKFKKNTRQARLLRVRSAIPEPRIRTKQMKHT